MPLSPETGLGPDKNPEIVFPFPAGDRESKEEPMSEFRRDDTASWDAQGARREPTPAHHSKSRPRRRRQNPLAVLVGYLIFVLLASAILAGMGWMLGSDFCAFNRGALRETSVEVTAEDSVSTVADKLQDAGLIKYKWFFKLYAGISHADKKIGIGTYTLNTEMDYRALILGMHNSSGNLTAETVTVTIPEGYTMEQIFHKLEDENVCSYDDLMDAAANYSYNYSFIDQSMQGDAKRLEGFLFPDTYEFYQGMQASSAINKFLENFHDRITAEMLEKADERSMTMQEVVTVASMIEKEAANDDERAMIAAVIYNRIAAGMPLQIDSTIMYVLPEHKDVLTVEDTKIDSPYNTYQNKGLPPTSIANPGLASIKATLSPASTQALYYALDAESGTHKFFTSYGEFQAFVAKQSYSQ